METIILSGSSKSSMKLLLEIAQKFGITSRKLSITELEDVGLIKAIQKGETGEYVDTNSYLRKLRGK